MIQKLIKIYLFLSLPIFLIIVNTKALATTHEHMRCVEAIVYYEKKYNLPKNLLYAISIVESGSKNDQHGVLLPWPWTLNISGNSHFASSPEKALTLLRQAVNKKTQVDVGCAQINWQHHGHHFKHNPQHIFNPVYNVAYAAHFLTNNYLETKQWPKAIAYYHSRSVERGMNYANKVIKIWNKINSDPKYKNIQIQNKSSIRTGKNKTNSKENKHTTMLVYKNSKFPQTIIKKTQTTGEELTPINAIIPNNISQIKDRLANNQEQKEIPSNQ